MKEEGEEKNRDKTGIFYEIVGDRSQMNPKAEVKDENKNGDQPSTSTSKKGMN